MSGARDEALIQAFALVLRNARVGKGLTQEALAFEAGIDRTFVSLLEGGKRQPSLSVIFTLARALGTTAGVMVSAVERSIPP